MTTKRFDALSATIVSAGTLCAESLCATSLNAPNLSGTNISGSTISGTNISAVTVTTNIIKSEFSGSVAVSGGKTDLAITSSAANVVWRGNTAKTSGTSADVMIRFYNPDGIVLWVPAFSAIASG